MPWLVLLWMIQGVRLIWVVGVVGASAAHHARPCKALTSLDHPSPPGCNALQKSIVVGASACCLRVLLQWLPPVCQPAASRLADHPSTLWKLVSLFCISWCRTLRTLLHRHVSVAHSSAHYRGRPAGSTCICGLLSSSQSCRPILHERRGSLVISY